MRTIYALAHVRFLCGFLPPVESLRGLPEFYLQLSGNKIFREGSQLSRLVMAGLL